MKKTVIALAALSVAGVAYAQSNVTIYGAADLGYRDASNASITMAERYNTRLGFMGQEDLGGGLKATFQLEQRFTLVGGRSSSRGDFEGAANLGLTGSFGQVRFGRLNELSTETYRRVDPFDQYGVATMIQTPLRGNNTEGRLSNAARYDSMNINGFKFGATYSIKNNPDAVENNGGWGQALNTNAGYAVSATYTNGPAYLVANYNKSADSNDSFNWNLGGAYTFGPVRLSAGYERSSLKLGVVDKQTNWVVGAAYSVGSGVINAMYSNSEWDAANASADKWAIGYTHNLSKRTSLYANYAHTSYDGSYRAPSTTASSGGSVKTSANDGYGVEVGITHKF